jgi:hypothetical protein
MTSQSTTMSYLVSGKFCFTKKPRREGRQVWGILKVIQSEGSYASEKDRAWCDPSSL